jgi:hypothetical protein
MEVRLNKFTYKEIAKEVHKKVIEIRGYEYITINDVLNYFAINGEFRMERFPADTYNFYELIYNFIHEYCSHK